MDGEQLLQELSLLREVATKQMVQIEQLERDKSALHSRCQTLQVLYVEVKQDRNRLSRLLASAQRELVHIKRTGTVKAETLRRKRVKQRNPPPPYCSDEEPSYRRFENVDTDLDSPTSPDARMNLETITRLFELHQNTSNPPESKTVIESCVDSSQNLLEAESQDENNVAIIKEEEELNSKEVQIRRSSFCIAHYGLFFDTSLSSGVIVVSVVPNSEAFKAGIRAKDQVLEICGLNMRTANYRLAEKILRESDVDRIQIKVTSEPKKRAIIKRPSKLVRRDAFKNKLRIHSFFERKRTEHRALYQTYRLPVALPRKINVPQSLEKIRLLGGNAVGIFVHSIYDDQLSSFLQTGDQLLEYNNRDLTNATAEDAAIELAKPIRDAVLVVLFNIDTYKQVEESSISDSFYIRTEFNRNSINKSLAFKKGDILHVDNTLYNGKPGYWRACQVDQYGRTLGCGVIPSKYNAECELLKRFQCGEQCKLLPSPFRFLRLLFSQHKYTRLKEKTRVLASFSYTYFEDSEPEEKEEELVLNNVNSYRIVRMIRQHCPRPVLIFGPYSNLFAQKLVDMFPETFRLCPLKLTDGQHGPYLYCTRNDGDRSRPDCVSVGDLKSIQNTGHHPVIPVVTNTVDSFERNQLYPVVVQLKFRSARHIRETINNWHIFGGRLRVGNKTARAIYNHALQLQVDFESNIDIVIMGNNVQFMATQAKERIGEEQNKVIWTEHAQ